ncbi:MAG: hypothetical protein H8E31_12700 [Planctomycetes bacterium]|nr:hypothetical protein [Planctomycetota bacterium]
MLLAAALLLTCPLPQDKPPNLREIRKLVDLYFELDPLEAADYSRRLEIVVRLDGVALDSSSKRQRWRKDLMKAASKRPELPDEAGEHWAWEEERRGRFFIGGETRRPNALLISMHGGGLGRADAAGAVGFHDAAARELGWLAIFPQALKATERGWTDSGTEEWVLSLIESALRTWKIPPDRVFLAGHSMGGYGSWTLGAHHADRLAGAAPSAGAPTPVYNYSEEIIDIQEGVIPNLRNLPMAVFQSDDDPQVPPDANQFAVAKVEEAKTKWGGYQRFSYWQVTGQGHGGPPGGAIELLRRIEKERRDPVPQKLVWQPVLEWKRRWYWLHWPEPKLNSVVVAELDREANAVRFESEADLAGMEVLLDERVLDLKKEVVIYLNGEESWRGVVLPTLGSLILSAGYGDESMLFESRAPVRR